MRIGDSNYIDKRMASENQVMAEASEHAEPTPAQRKRKKWKNWWYYYKWYVICGILLFGILLNVAGSYLGWWSRTPDFQVAYIGKTELPVDTVSALEQAFASLAADFNGDGEIIVQINQYISGLEDSDSDTAYYEYASEISLIGDISDCESYFFLMDDPKQFQFDFQLLACPDGSCPDDTDYSIEDKVIPWAACPILSQMDLGDYSTALLGQKISGSNQELLSGFSLGRRCFFTESVTDYSSQCNDLWKTLYDSCQNHRQLKGDDT